MDEIPPERIKLVVCLDQQFCFVLDVSLAEIMNKICQKLFGGLLQIRVTVLSQNDQCLVTILEQNNRKIEHLKRLLFKQVHDCAKAQLL